MAVAIVGPAQVSPRPLESLVIGTTRVTFEPSISFDSARTLLGRAGKRGRADADAALDWLCYRVGSGADRGYLFLEGSEMGGGRYITGFTLARPGTDPTRETECSPLAVAVPTIATDRGIRLGMSRADVRRILGSPSFGQGDSLQFTRSDERRGQSGAKPSVDYSEFSTLSLKFRRGVLVWMSGERFDVT